MRVIISTGLGHEEATRSGAHAIDKELPGGIRDTATYTFLVEPSNQEVISNLTEYDAITAFGVPQLGAGLSWNSASKVTKSTATEVDSINGIWRVVVEYDEDIDDVEELVSYYWDTEHIEKLVETDPVTGDPIVNSVGERFKVTAPQSIAVLTYEVIPIAAGAFSTPTETQILTYCDKTNLNPFWGFPSGCVLMAGIRDRPVIVGGISRRKLTYVLKVDISFDHTNQNRLGWAIEVLNQGTKYKSSTSFPVPTQNGRLTGPGLGEHIPFLDIQKQPTTGNLDLNGNAIGPYDPASPTSNMVWLKFNRFPKIDFSPLGIIRP